MFEEVLLNEPRGRKRRYFALAVLGQVAVIGILLAIPLLTVEQLPLAELTNVLVAPPPPPPPPPPAPVAAARVARAVTTTPRFDMSKLTAPRTVPKTIPQVADLPPGPVVDTATAGAPGGVASGQVGGVVGGVLGGVIGSLPAVAPPPPTPPPPVAAAPETPKIVRIGGQVEAAKVISAPPPAYPVLAKDAMIQGAVKMDAVIGENGHIEDLHVTSGPPLLINAAVAAVKQWTYHPTILNGVPVKVATEIVVTFTLG